MRSRDTAARDPLKLMPGNCERNFRSGLGAALPANDHGGRAVKVIA